MALAAGWMCFRAELRRRWRAWLALALIVGAFAGVVEAAAAGARRTDAAYPALLAWSYVPDVMLFSYPGQSGTFGQFSPAAAARLPQAVQSAVIASYQVATPAAADLVAPETGQVPGRFWRRRVLLAGRLPDPARPGEVNISFTLAQAAHLEVGDMLRTKLLTAAGTLEQFRFRIVGIDAAPAEFPRRPAPTRTTYGRPPPSIVRTAPASMPPSEWRSGCGTERPICPACSVRSAAWRMGRSRRTTRWRRRR